MREVSGTIRAGAGEDDAVVLNGVIRAQRGGVAARLQHLLHVDPIHPVVLIDGSLMLLSRVMPMIRVRALSVTWRAFPHPHRDQRGKTALVYWPAGRGIQRGSRGGRGGEGRSGRQGRQSGGGRGGGKPLVGGEVEDKDGVCGLFRPDT